MGPELTGKVVTVPPARIVITSGKPPAVPSADQPQTVTSPQAGVSETFLLISSVLLTVSTIYLVENIGYMRRDFSITRSAAIREVRATVRRETTPVLQRRQARRPRRQEQDRNDDEIKDIIEEIMDRALEKLQGDDQEKSSADQKADPLCLSSQPSEACRQPRLVCQQTRC
jgi:hypothetical protein